MTLAVITFRAFSIPESPFIFYCAFISIFYAGAYGQQHSRNWVRGASFLLVIGWLTYSIFFQQRGSDVPTQTILYQLSVLLIECIPPRCSLVDWRNVSLRDHGN